MTEDELVIGLIARLILGCGTVAVGSSSPVQATAALLAEAVCPERTRALIFRNNVEDPFPESGSELYDRIGQGRIDVFFLSGGQIDGQANLNMVGVGEYPRTRVRFPGTHGTPFIYTMVPRVILYREEHSQRVLVSQVDFISAPGITPPDVYRRGGPSDLITSKAHFTFDPKDGGFTLATVHPGHTVDEIVENTGFTFSMPKAPGQTSPPPRDWLDLLHGPVRERVSQTYPQFAASRLGARR